MPSFNPQTVKELQACVLETLVQNQTLSLTGSGSKAQWGRMAPLTQTPSNTLHLGNFNQVVSYEPEELVLVVQPGMLLSDVESLLAEKGQMLAFEPPYWMDGSTIGGIIACNLSGPRRPFAGAVRDHLLGFEGVSGRGEILHGGGRVVKNVTGYDLSKLMCGSYGALVAMSEVCLKVLPRPQTQCTFVSTGLERSQALALLRQANLRTEGFSALACLEPNCPAPQGLEQNLPNHERRVLIRLEGPSLMIRSLMGEMKHLHRCSLQPLDQEASSLVWQAMREVPFMRPQAHERLWRISLPSSQAQTLATQLEAQQAKRLAFDWGGSLVWALLPARVTGAKIHPMVSKLEGWAMCVQNGSGDAQEPFPEEPTPCTPLQGVKRALNQRIKAAFDPNAILNPHRLHPEF